MAAAKKAFGIHQALAGAAGMQKRAWRVIR
jgi:hypothetical protein